MITSIKPSGVLIPISNFSFILGMIEPTVLMHIIFRIIGETPRKSFILYELSYLAFLVPHLEQRINQIYRRFRVSAQDGMSQESWLARKKVSP